MKAVKPNPRTSPIGVILVANLPEAQAVKAAMELSTAAIVRRAIHAEFRDRARGAVLVALGRRLVDRLRAEGINAEAERGDRA